jgi:hypothetical protein
MNDVGGGHLVRCHYDHTALVELIKADRAAAMHRESTLLGVDPTL